MRALESHKRTNAAATLIAAAAVITAVGVIGAASPAMAISIVVAVVCAWGLHQWARVQERHEHEIAEAVSVLSRTLEDAHSATLEHGRRIAPLVRKTAIEMGLTHRTAEELALAAMLHDIGKVNVDEKILDKPGPLTPDEFAEIKKHVLAGADILRSYHGLDRWSSWVKYHHERVDGKGYLGLKGSRIPLPSRILAVVDAYDAMVDGGDQGSRPYRPRISRQEALRELRACAGRQFDLHAVQAFCRVEYENASQTVH
jgi:putative nucleotidyltransferase with HDIG domain